MKNASSSIRGYNDHANLGPPLLGAVLILAGLFVIFDINFASVISAKFIAVAAIAAGAFEIIYAIWATRRSALLWQGLLGALYIAFGIALLNPPASGALLFTYVLGLLLLMSGFVRILLGVGYWRDVGRTMLLSGVFGILAGLIILTGFPMTGLWVLGLLLGIDLIGHGIAWLTYGWPLSTVRNA